MPHPTILAFGDTEQQSFPLLLVIGREPNAALNTPIANIVEAFAVDHDSSCAFWNRSHAQMARVGGGNTPSHEFRALRRQMNSSPIIYADSLGICVPFRHPERDNHRLAWARNLTMVNGHVDNIFGHEIINRVSLVILSGLKAKIFQGAVDRILEKCNLRELPHVHVSFFGSRLSTNTLDSNFTPKSQILLGHIYGSFIQG